MSENRMRLQMNRFVYVTVFVFCVVATAYPQSSEHAADKLGSGLSISAGLGHLAVLDDYISNQWYSGSLPYFEAAWLRRSDSSAYRLGFIYRYSSDIRNYNVSAGITEALLSLDFLSPTGGFSLLGRDVFAYWGPSAEFFVYYRQQNIASGGNALFNAYSFAMFFSGGINSTLSMPLESDFTLMLSGELNLLSFGARLTDLNDHDARFVKFGSLLSGVRGHTDLMLRYDLSNALSASAHYRFEICQSGTWNYLIAVSDNLVATVTYRL